jgi:cysteine synthase
MPWESSRRLSSGALHTEQTVVEVTRGNMGTRLAIVCAAKVVRLRSEVFEYGLVVTL